MKISERENDRDEKGIVRLCVAFCRFVIVNLEQSLRRFLNQPLNTR